MATQPAPHPQSSMEDSSNGSEHSTSQELHGGAKKASNKQLQRSFVKRAKPAPVPILIESESESDENDGLSQLPPPQSTPKPSAKPTPSKAAAAAAAASSASAKTHKKLKHSVSAAPPSDEAKEDKKRLSLSNTKEDNKKRKLASASAANPAEAAPPPPLPSPTNNAAAGTTHTARDAFDRMWTAEDELALLEGLSTFMSNHDGKLPTGKRDKDVLYDSLRTSFSRNFSQSQLWVKIYCLKRKYTKERKIRNMLYAVEKKTMDDVGKKTLDLVIKIWGKKQNEVISSTAGRQNSMPKLLRPKAEFVEKRAAAHLPSSSGANPGQPISQKESVSSLSDSPFVDFVANWLDCMNHDSVRTIIANMSSDKCRMLEEIWERFTQIEMNYQAHRLDTASSIITIFTDRRNR